MFHVFPALSLRFDHFLCVNAPVYTLQPTVMQKKIMLCKMSSYLLLALCRQFLIIVTESFDTQFLINHKRKNWFYIHHLFYGPTGYQLSMFYRAAFPTRAEFRSGHFSTRLAVQPLPIHKSKWKPNGSLHILYDALCLADGDLLLYSIQLYEHTRYTCLYEYCVIARTHIHLMSKIHEFYFLDLLTSERSIDAIVWHGYIRIF